MGDARRIGAGHAFGAVCDLAGKCAWLTCCLHLLNLRSKTAKVPDAAPETLCRCEAA
jgi:hypothetical protein